MNDSTVRYILIYIIVCVSFAGGWIFKPDPYFLVEMRGATGGAFTGLMSKENCALVRAEIYKREIAFKAANPDDKQGELQAICYPQ
jgi:hypothetical protein